MERLYAAMITKWDVHDTVSNWFGIVLGSQHNECQQLNHRKTKHGPLHDVPDQNYLILPIYRHIWKVWRSQSFRPSLSSYQKSCKDLVKYCLERFVLMLESVRSDFNVRSLRLLTNAASSHIRRIMCILSTPRPIYRSTSRSTYRPTLDRCIGRHSDRVSAFMCRKCSRYQARHSSEILPNTQNTFDRIENKDDEG